MLKICKKIRFSSDENKMNSIANTKIARDLYYSAKNQNVKFLLEKRKKVINDLVDYDIIHKNDLGFVVIIKFKDDTEKENLINYCKNNNLEWTECPRYIRINQKAISIEIKRL